MTDTSAGFEPGDAICPDGRTIAEHAADPIIDGPEPPGVLDDPGYYTPAFERAQDADAGWAGRGFTQPTTESDRAPEPGPEAS